MRKTKIISLCSILTALGVALLWLGAVTDILDITFCFASSIIIVFAQIELGSKAALLIYAATGILSVILLPTKFAAAAYLLFAGNYPIIKYFLEKKVKSKTSLFIIKIAYFSLAMGIMIAISKFIFLVDDGLVISIIIFVLGLFACIIFDYLIRALVSLYYAKLRKRLRIDKILK